MAKAEISKVKGLGKLKHYRIMAKSTRFGFILLLVKEHVILCLKTNNKNPNSATRYPFLFFICLQLLLFSLPLKGLSLHIIHHIEPFELQSCQHIVAPLWPLSMAFLYTFGDWQMLFPFPGHWRHLTIKENSQKTLHSDTSSPFSSISD